MVKRTRLKKMINWSVQGPIVNRLLLHVLAYNAATLCLLMLVYGVRTSLAIITDQPTMTSPLTVWQHAAPVVVCMLIMVPYMVWDLMKLTNRIAGPLHRFESLLKDFIKSGTLNPANLREFTRIQNEPPPFAIIREIRVMPRLIPKYNDALFHLDIQPHHHPSP